MMVRWLARFVVRRLRWVALVTALRALVRRSAVRSVDQASDELKDRLPDNVIQALSTMPGDPLRVGGSALATSRGARSAYRASRRATGSASRVARRVAGGSRTVRGIPGRFVDEVRHESERERRLLWSEYRRAEGDHRAADELLLDRFDPAGARGEEDPLPEIPEAVPTGRFRSVDESPPPVNRRLRTYRRQVKPWDRPRRASPRAGRPNLDR
jgi:hypothetical protein